MADIVAPIIETARLRLRPHRPGDLEDSARMWADPIVTRYIGGRPATPEEVWSRLLRYAGLWSLLGFGYWAVEERSSGRFIGEAGFADFRRQLTPSLDGAPEIGWALIPPAHGQGYATEIVGAAVDWGDAHLEAKRTVCLIDPGNGASLTVARRCGYREYARAEYKGALSILLERPAAT